MSQNIADLACKDGEADVICRLPTGKINVPTLFIQATKDSVLQPHMSKGMEKWLTNLTRGEVDGTHWVLVQRPDEVNKIIREWLEKEVLGGKTVL